MKRNDGRGHIAYISARQGNNFKINTITHATTFYGEPTIELSTNPNVSSKDKRISRFSVPVWQSANSLKTKPKGVWRLSKRDRVKIKKFNKKYANNYKK